jgi:prolyl 4-hydroxylase
MKKSTTPKSNQRQYIENDKELEIFTIPNFLTDEECNYLCDYIETNNFPSSVAGSGNKKSTYDSGRTSSTSTIPDSDPIFETVNNKMYTELGIDASYSETTQGQIYQEGQHFNHHNDYFDGDAYVNHCLSSGQRTWTFMIYLNDVEEGGDTEFRNLDLKIKPIKGTAVAWKNSNGTGTENPASHHCGTHVTKGKKIIITKWFRENVYNAAEDSRLADEYHKNVKRNTQYTFNTPAQLPKLTNFILPSGNIHLSRAICRRCERKLVSAISNNEHIPNKCLAFLNRLSDYLFTEIFTL